jgi:hypothetical protein
MVWVRQEVIMDPVEAQGRAIIAAALIVRGAVEVPSMPTGGRRTPDGAEVRLHELTEYVYRLVTTDDPRELE